MNDIKTRNDFSTAALDLFGCVPYFVDHSEDEDYVGEFTFLKGHGVVIAATANHAKVDIINWLQQKYLTGQQLNKSFYKSWEKALTVSTASRLFDQALHYLTTYGFEKWDCYSVDTVYLPEGILKIPEKVEIRVISGKPAEWFFENCLALLGGTALSQDTLEKIFLILDGLGYEFSGTEFIQNREAIIMLADKKGILPKRSEDLFRYLFYKATGETLVIKNKAAELKIAASRFELPKLTGSQLCVLAETFNRYKPLWLAIKKAHIHNGEVVNKISKLSKRLHVPLRENALNAVTYKPLTNLASLTHATTPQIVRALNACMVYGQGGSDRYYRIRNGKGYVNQQEPKDIDLILGNRDLLLAYLKDCLNSKKLPKVYIPEYLDYGFPTSEKSFIGNMPSGTKISLPRTNDVMLIGIYWEDLRGERSDVDLSSLSVGGKVGWNASWRTSDNGLAFSGDVTTAPQGAAEWLYCRSISEAYTIQASNYTRREGQPFKLIVGYGDSSEISKNYMIDPNKVMFSADLVFVEAQMSLGLIVPTEDGIEFHLSNLTLGDKNIASADKKSNIARGALLDKSLYQLRVRDLLTVVNTPEEADLDLSYQNLTKETLISLFK